MFRVSAPRKPGQMGAAVALRDVVGETQHGFVIAVIPLHRHFDGDAVAFPMHRNRVGDNRGFRTVDVFCEGNQTALVMHVDFDRFWAPRRRSDCRRTPEFRNANSRRRCSSVGKVIIGLREDRGRCLKGNLRTAFWLAVFFQRCDRQRLPTVQPLRHLQNECSVLCLHAKYAVPTNPTAR